MLESIKSSFFQKILFSHIIKSKELDIVKYNKNLQTQLGLNLKHYQIFCKNYIIMKQKILEKNILV